VENGHYVTPTEPGYSVQMKEASMEEFGFPGVPGKGWWQSEEAMPILTGEKL
jgi:L-galactonate dehydratase